jgi:hypothetical protein
MNDTDTKRAIENSLKSFATTPLAGAAIALFEALGYRSEKLLAQNPVGFSPTLPPLQPF